MNVRKRLGMFLLACGLLLLGVSGVFWRGDATRRAETAAKRVVLEDSASRIQADLVDLNLKKRGFQESLPNMPDTVARYGGGKVMEISGNYTRQIYRLEMKKRDVNLDMLALERETAKERAEARARALPVAAAGGACLLIGVVLAVTSGRRVGA